MWCSNQQIAAIEYAKTRILYNNYDFLKDNPGQEYADKFYCVSTTDMEAVLEIAQKEKIDGIVAYASDPAAPTAAYVAEKMGLATNPYKSVEILTNKDKFRLFLEKHNFHTPKAKGYSSIEEAKIGITFFKLPVIIKPVDSSGSKGVSILTDIIDLDQKFEYALRFSRVKRVIIEEYVEMVGYQVAGDGFSLNGKLLFRCFGNDHFDKSGLNPFVPIAASFPYIMPEKVHNKIHNEIQRLFDLLKMKTGAYNFDIRVDNNDNVYLMEIGPRNGGNFIPQVIEYATGINMIDYTIRAAMGEDCSDIKMFDPNGYWSYYAIHSAIAGRLKEVIIDENVKANHIVEYHLNYRIGDNVPAFTGQMKYRNFIMKFESKCLI